MRFSNTPDEKPGRSRPGVVTILHPDAADVNAGALAASLGRSSRMLLDPSVSRELTASGGIIWRHADGRTATMTEMAESRPSGHRGIIVDLESATGRRVRLRHPRVPGQATLRTPREFSMHLDLLASMVGGAVSHQDAAAGAAIGRFEDHCDALAAIASLEGRIETDASDPI